jgi:hypothetical protein
MTADPAGPVATLQLWHVPSRRVPAAVARMALDRPTVRAAPALRFAKLLGTGAGRTFTVRDADVHRWGLFAVWDHLGAWRAFCRDSAMPRRWASISDEQWQVALAPLRWKGRWAGRDPFAGVDGSRSWEGPVAALTRARIRWAKSPAFWRAVPPVSADLRDRDGVLFALGIGEAPIGLQGTFSVWRSADALAAFAYGGQEHRDAIRLTATQQWYAEELFARFGVLSSAGTVQGRDPLAQLVQM